MMKKSGKNGRMSSIESRGVKDRNSMALKNRDKRREVSEREKNKRV